MRDSNIETVVCTCLYIHFLEATRRPSDKPAENTNKLCQVPIPGILSSFCDSISAIFSRCDMLSPKKDCIRPQAVIDDPDMFDCILLSIDDRLLISFCCFSCLLFGSAKYASTHSTANLFVPTLRFQQNDTSCLDHRNPNKMDT